MKMANSDVINQTANKIILKDSPTPTPPITSSYHGVESYTTNNPIQVERISQSKLKTDAILMPKEISTQNLRSLFNTAAEVLRSMDTAKTLILEGIDLSRYYLETDEAGIVEQLTFNHLLHEDYWISNNLSSRIYAKAETILKETMLGEDPLFEAGKLFGETFSKWKMTIFQFMSIKQLIKVVQLFNESYNTITKITVTEYKDKTRLEYTYKDNITKSINNRPISKQVCNWNRGVWYYFAKLLSYTHISVIETECVADGADKCVFEITYRSENIRHRLQKIILSFISPDLIKNYERALRQTDIVNYNLKKIVHKQTAELQHLNNTDALTKVRNRRYFDTKIGQYTKMSSRSMKTISIIMLDIDYFKKINDTYGHPFGDRCLQLVAQNLSRHIQRENDFIARYGGEEFVVVLPATDINGSKILAEKMCRSIAQMKIPIENGRKFLAMTISAGVAEGSKDEKQIVAAADAALYSAKRNGRNRVEINQSQIEY
jgi:diguanylate cyclase (GGDEF)-like protein